MKRDLKLLSPTVESLLINQANHEMKNFNLYKVFQNFFELEGLLDLATYYEQRAKEEFNHHNWIYSYLTDADCGIKYIDNTENVSNLDIITPFILTVKREVETTELIYKIYEQCLVEKDYMTASWLLQKLIPEQIEEENTSRMAQTIMEIDGDIFKKCNKVKSLLNY